MRLHATEDQVIDHILGDADEAVSAHVAGCAACHQQAEDIEKVLEATEYVPEMPEDFPAIVMERLEPRLRPRRRWPAYAFAVAAAVAAAVLSAAITARLMYGPGTTAATPLQDRPAVVLTSSPRLEKAGLHSPTVFYAPGARPPTIPPPGTYRVTPPKPFIVNVTAPASASREQDADDLAKMAETAEPLDKRIEAVNALMLVASTRADDDLVTLYQKEPNETMRHAIVHALLIRGIQQFPRQRGKQALRQLLFQENDRDRQKELTEALRLIEAREMKQHRTANDEPRR